MLLHRCKTCCISLITAVVISLFAQIFSCDSAVYAQAPASVYLPAQIASLTGTYTVTGTNSRGQTYTGTTTITQVGNKYTFSQNINGDKFDGVGLLTDNTFSVGWVFGNRFGVVVYTVVSDNRLQGIWAEWISTGQDQILQENLTRNTIANNQGIQSTPALTGLAPLGSYRIIGTDLQNNPYVGTMSLTQKGLVYTQIRIVNGVQFDGVGLVVGNILSVGWRHDEQQGVLVYLLQSNANLNATWISSNSENVATEQALQSRIYLPLTAR